MKTIFSSLVLLFLTGFLFQGAVYAAPMKKSPPPWAPAHGKRAQHNYYYYPSAHVYFDLDRKIYFFLKDGIWKTALSLPRFILLSPKDFIKLELDTDSPFKYFHEHKKKYPGKKMKLKKRRKRRK